MLQCWEKPGKEHQGGGSKRFRAVSHGYPGEKQAWESVCRGAWVLSDIALGTYCAHENILVNYNYELMSQLWFLCLSTTIS